LLGCRARAARREEEQAYGAFHLRRIQGD
jgi:hypothetical protein